MFLRKLAGLFHKKPKPPPVQIPDRILREVLREKVKAKKGSLEDIILFCDETRATLRIMKQTMRQIISWRVKERELLAILHKALISLYSEYGNLKDKAVYLEKTRHDRKGHPKVKKEEPVGE